MQGKMRPLQSNENQRTEKGMLGLGLRTRIILYVLYIHPFEGISALTF